MTRHTRHLVNKLWNYCSVLRDDGLSYGDYVEQLTYLLFRHHHGHRGRQVKRHKGSIGRPVLDQLRGALPYFKAIRGTIITLGTFTKGCQDVAVFPGAAPITLIDGERLIERLVKHGVGVQKKPAFLYELDDTFLKSEDAPEEMVA